MINQLTSLVGPNDVLPEGLTGAEAAKRLQEYGPNTVAEARSRGVGTLARKFWG